MLNIWDLWAREWTNAYTFFNSKGNIKTKSRLKDKWNKDFTEILKLVEKEVIKKSFGDIEEIIKKLSLDDRADNHTLIMVQDDINKIKPPIR